MPELPEVESVRRTLHSRLPGRTVLSVDVRRADVIHGKAAPADLLVGQRIHQLVRHGKQLAIVGDAPHRPCLCIHLGMTGSLRISKACEAAPAAASAPPTHVHIAWRLDDGSTLAFRDPRRFGGVWTFPTLDDLRSQRWSALGEDALAITPARLHAGLLRTTRCLKAALLDQSLVAGLGNIYVDELLYAARLSPHQPANTITRRQAAGLVARMRTLLSRAVDAGGSTLRDYVDGDGRSGSFQLRHRVYGRAGRRCARRGCHGVVHTEVISGRTTAWCPVCQAGGITGPATPTPDRERR